MQTQKVDNMLNSYAAIPVRSQTNHSDDSIIITLILLKIPLAILKILLVFWHQ